MTKEHVDLILGSLLHDVGKVVFRTGERKNHSQSGFEYLRDEIGLGEDPSSPRGATEGFRGATDKTVSQCPGEGLG